MTKRIEQRRQRVGQGYRDEYEEISEIEARRAKHERLTRGVPSRAFGEVLKDRLKRDHPEEEAEEQQAPVEGAIDPLLGLTPGQDAALSNRPEGRRSGRVIVKG